RGIEAVLARGDAHKPGMRTEWMMEQRKHRIWEWHRPNRRRTHTFEKEPIEIHNAFKSGQCNARPLDPWISLNPISTSGPPSPCWQPVWDPDPAMSWRSLARLVGLRHKHSRFVTVHDASASTTLVVCHGGRFHVGRYLEGSLPRHPRGAYGIHPGIVDRTP